MCGITPHDHRGVLWVGQKRDGTGIGNGVDTTQFDIDLEADIREILRFRLFALVTLQALSWYPNLVVSQVSESRCK